MKESNNISIDARYRTMLILWVGQMMSVIMFFVVTQFANSSAEPDPSTSSSLSWVFLGLGALSAIISFLVRSKILQRSVEKQDPALVQTGVTVGLALCEVPALLGVVERFAFPGSNYYLLFVIAVAGMALHFPRRDFLLAASYKDPSFGASS